MKTDTPQTVYLKDYSVPAYLVDTVDLDFNIASEATMVSATLARRRNPARPGQPLVLDGNELETLSVTVDGEKVAFSLTADTLTIADLPDACTLRTVVRIHPERNTRLSGLYRSRDGYFTQCEAQGFRSITWFLDRPDVMSTYTVTLHADRVHFPVLLLANGLYAKLEFTSAGSAVVGLALAIFFLLLIAFSEHLPFYAAYGLSAVACIGLIATYLAGALGGMRQGLAFGAGLTGLYGVLYGVLLSEDNALLMGSVLLFLALGTTMLATRRLDWYRLGAQLNPDSEAGEP